MSRYGRYRRPGQSRGPFAWLAGCGCVALLGLFGIGLIGAALNGGFKGQPQGEPQPLVNRAKDIQLETKQDDREDSDEPTAKREVKTLPSGEKSVYVHPYRRKDGTMVEGHYRRQPGSK